jgi:hypothetical protein
LSSSSDPIRAARRRLIVTAATIAVGAAACAVWAFRPLASSSAEAPRLQARDAPVLTDVIAPVDLDRTAFDALLWNPAPAEAGAAAGSPRGATRNAVRLTLVGVVEEGGVRTAALYDPAQDRLVLATTGDRIGAYTVRSVDADRVELATGRRTFLLRLREDR